MLSVLYRLERTTGSLELLAFLYTSGPASKTRIQHALRPTQYAIDRSLAVLMDYALVEVDEKNAFPFTKTYRLSSLGRRVAEAPVIVWSTLIAARA
jgi:predicted transcriptional regulator